MALVFFLMPWHLLIMQTNSDFSMPQTEASVILKAKNLQVRAGFRASTPETLAGGPIEIEFFVESLSGEPLYLAVGGDRARLRPAFFSFTAELEGAEIELDDPAAKIPERGGPATVIQVKTGAPNRYAILVNEFVRLEKVSAALKPGEVRELRIRCQRPLPLALSNEQAFQFSRDTSRVDVTLVIHVRRDDAALETLIARLAAEVRGDQIGAVEREQAIKTLVALRHPVALPYLQMFRDHPDPAVRMYVQWALMQKDKDDEGRH